MIAEILASASVWVAGLLGAPPVFPAITVTTVDEATATCAAPTPDGCYLGGDQPRIVLTQAAADDAIRFAGSTPLHEILHAYSAQARGPLLASSTPEQVAWEEAGAAAVTFDLDASWTRRIIGPGWTLASLDTRLRATTYPEQVAWLRGMSAAACRDTPDSRCARYWRRAWITGDRRAMVEQAATVPLVEGTQ